jgi:hypothetical protein
MLLNKCKIEMIRGPFLKYSHMGDDMRRFDYNYKDFTLPVNAVLTTFIRRTSYPVDELSTNGKNVPVIQLTDHLWWDQ